jgi:uncharacterized membrane protein (DUF106 family)
MKNYKSYMQEAQSLCTRAIKEKDSERTTQKLMDMQEQISHSDLTVYQKEFLMRQLGSIPQVAYA